MPSWGLPFTAFFLQIGGVFPRIGDTQSSTTRRQPVLFFCAVNQVGVTGVIMGGCDGGGCRALEGLRSLFVRTAW